ncbi:MAG: translation initiation factor [Verrucomicrobia bacterium]|nr:translation initiation factor [Verrucomicrobiota bacterium]
MKNKKRISTDGTGGLEHSPFAGLSSLGLPSAPELPVENQPNLQPVQTQKPARNRGRVDIIRQTAHRGGKTVTVVTGFVGIGLPEKEMLAKRMQKECGTGGTVKEGRIEIQGDKRPQVASILTEAGFRPVFAGG